MHADKTHENKTWSNPADRQTGNSSAVQFQDNRPKSAIQKMQLKMVTNEQPAKNPVQKKENNTGLPDRLKTGIENLSGHSMDDVKVHYNSGKPAQLNAHAYAQGAEIHLAPGQEKHLPHEAWHVAQQKQGRVKPTLQMKGKVNINDDRGLEKEADMMGARALQLNALQGGVLKKQSGANVVQRVLLTQINAASVPLRPAEQAKLTQVVAYMNVMGAPLVLPINTVQIRVLARRDADPSPAYTWTMAGTHIIVDMAEWYLRIASVGEITGLIAHEIGVHTLADARMTAPENAQEGLQNARPASVSVGLHTHTLAPWAGAADRRQLDHVNVVKDTGRGPGPRRPGRRGAPVRLNARTRMYVDTMLRLGDAINANAPAHDRDKQLQDLLGTFLFDYSRILVTDDGKAQYVFLKAHLITQVFNWYRNTVIRRYAGAHAWLNRPAVQPNSSGWGLRAYLLAKISAWAFEQLRSTRAGTAVEHGVQATGRVLATAGRAAGRGIGYIARPLAPVGRAAAYVVNPVARSIAWATRAAARGVRHIARPLAPVGRVAASVAGATLRGADHVYGEVENLGYNAVRGAWNLGATVVSGGWNLGRSALRRITG